MNTSPYASDAQESQDLYLQSVLVSHDIEEENENRRIRHWHEMKRWEGIRKGGGRSNGRFLGEEAR